MGLVVASGYLKVLGRQKENEEEDGVENIYELVITNFETKLMFQKLIRDWFDSAKREYNAFIKALLTNDVDAMNLFMNSVALASFSYFDTGVKRYREDPERFYHGFVLGLLVELQNEYVITSNRESGFGRYDVVIEPKNQQEKDAIIIEFKVLNEKREETLEDTIASALKQIEEKQYAAELMARGIPKERIRSYGFAFRGKEVLIGW